MPSISPSQDLVTLVNVFRLNDPANQQQLVAMLVQATQETMRHQPGFISANIHVSLDGTHVVNYAQWRTAPDFEAMRTNPAAQQHMRAAAQLAQVDGNLYTVAFSDERIAAAPGRV